MDFANERYVRLYVRDTVTWKRLKWDGQNALTQLLRKADRSGVIDLGGMEPWEALVVLCDAPEDAAKVGVGRVLELGCAVHDGDRLVFPRYIEANECAMSDKQRAKEYRERRAIVTKRDSFVTERDEVVTARHSSSHGVTARHSVPCRTVPSVQSHAVPSQNAPAREEQESDQPPGSALAGRVWLREVLGRDDFDHHGKWAHAFEQIARKPESERAAAAESIKRELDKPGIRAVMHPQHVLDYWARYSSGTAPGKQTIAKADTTETAKWRSRVQQSTRALEELKERLSRLQPGPNYHSQKYDLDKAIREETENLERRRRELHALTG